MSFRVTSGSQRQLLLLGEHIGKKRAGFRTGLNESRLCPTLPTRGPSLMFAVLLSRSRINHGPRTPPTLLVGMWINVVPMENSKEAPQKTKLPYESCNTTLGPMPSKTIIQKDTCTPVIFLSSTVYNGQDMATSYKPSLAEDWIKL